MGVMTAQIPAEAASEAAKLEQKLALGEYDAASSSADLNEEAQQASKAAVASLKAVQDKVGTATSNREELLALTDSCVAVTAQVLVTCRRAGMAVDVALLQDRFLRVGGLIGQCGFRRRVEGVVKGAEDRAAISELQDLVGKLAGDINLAGMLMGEKKSGAGEALRNARVTAKEDDDDRAGVSKLHSIQEEEDEVPRTGSKLARVPDATPVIPSWHVERDGIMQDLCNNLFDHVGSPHLLGIVGDSGSGKTTCAAEFVRRKDVREMFCDGILWLTVNRGGKDRIPALMRQLATAVHETVTSRKNRPPTASDPPARYIRKIMERGGGHKYGERLRCLVVADNVWEAEVIMKLRETAMWVLVTTCRAELMTEARGSVVEVGPLSEEDARLVLRRAAEVRDEGEVPGDDATNEVIELCGRTAIDLVSVGRWSTIRGKDNHLAALSDAAATIRADLENTRPEGINEGESVSTRAERRMAILRAGLRILGCEDERARWLCLALAVMPDGYAFSVSDAAMLLDDGPFEDAIDETAAEAVLCTLQQWGMVTGAVDVGEARGRPQHSRFYRLHEVYSDAARSSLKDHVGVCRSAVRTWVEHLSSLEVLKSTDVHVLMELWRAVELVRDEGWASRRPYEISLSRMDKSDPEVCRESVAAVANFHFVGGDMEAEYMFRQQLLELEQRVLGPAHPGVLNTLTRLADCARGIGDVKATKEWYLKAESISSNIMFHMQDGFYKDDSVLVESLKSLAWSMMEAGERTRAEMIFRQVVDIQEAQSSPNDVKLANTLYKLGRCIREAGGRDEEAQIFLLRAMHILEAKRRPDHWLTMLTLEQLELCTGGDAAHDDMTTASAP